MSIVQKVCYRLCLQTTFREPPMLEIEDVLLPKSNSKKIENDLLHKGITQTFLLCAEETKQDEDDDQDCDNSEKLQRRSKNTLLPSSLRISFLTRRNHSVLGNSFQFLCHNSYSVPQYVCSALITFVVIEVLEELTLNFYLEPYVFKAFLGNL